VVYKSEVSGLQCCGGILLDYAALVNKERKVFCDSKVFEFRLCSCVRVVCLPVSAEDKVRIRVDRLERKFNDDCVRWATY